MEEWEMVAEEHHSKGEKNQYDFSFLDLVRKV